MPAPPTDPRAELAAEQAHLARARTELGRMRDHTLSLTADGGDAIAGEALAHTLWLRAKALQDDPGTTLFFGRLDLEAGDDDGDDGERLYIGRRHVSDADGDPVVVDWRAGVSTPFYRASSAEPLGVRRRRRFGIEDGRITALEDELLGESASTTAAGRAGASELLAREIERPRIGPMRDIVATIQPEQDEIVRADVGTTLCVQGAPGTGKTAVGLHRAAWLLYAFRERLARTGVLVVGPNRAFLEHVGAVLPSLGEISVRHTTVEELVGGHGRVRATDTTEAARLKGERGWPTCCAPRSGRRSGRRPSPSWCRGGLAGGGCRRTRSRTCSTSCAPGGWGMPPPAPCCTSGWRTRSWSRWSAPATPRTTGCRTPSRGRHRSRPTSRRSGPSPDPQRCWRTC